MYSALYAGKVFHLRLRPRRHALRYGVCYALIDLDEIPALAQRCRWFSHNRRNLFSLHDGDYDAAEGGLRARVEALLAEAGIVPDGGAIRLLTLPRILGYAFNPLSVFFCHRRDGTVAGIIYKVRNTFGETHCYVIAGGAAARVIRQQAPKRFHVSPFMGMNGTYHFDLMVPAERLGLRIREDDADGILLYASLTAARRAFDDRGLLWSLACFPFQTFTIVAAIHWEALRLWIKRIRIRRKPVLPPTGITIGTAHGG